MEWKNSLMLCLDTETTGLDPAKDKIVEVGAVSCCQGKILLAKSWLLNPGIPIPQEASAVHGITDAHVKDAPTLLEIAEELLSMVCEANVLVGYNWPFDASFFEAELGGGWLDSIEGTPIIDPLVVIRFDKIGRYWKGKGRHKLEAVAKRLGIEPEGDIHRASSDCIMTLRILRKLTGHLPDDGAQAHALLERERSNQDANFQAWLATQKAKESK